VEFNLVSCPYTYEQMGYVEYRHRKVDERSLTLLAHSYLPKSYQEDAFLTAPCIISHLP
jgi:hypothetical protein